MILLPRDHLSYSAASLWYSSKSAFRKKYYENHRGFSSDATDYGKEIAEMLKNDPENPIVAHIPKYNLRDEGFVVNIDGIPVLMFPDSLDDKTFSIREYKTGEWIDGKPAWTQPKADAAMQIKLYSLGVKLKYGQVNNLAHLDWLITREIKYLDQIKIGGKMYEVPIEQFQLTGEIKTFSVNVTDIERFRARQWILQAAYEISADYKNYLKGK